MSRRVMDHRSGRNGLALVAFLAFLCVGSEAFISPSVIRYPARPVTISRRYASETSFPSRISVILSASESDKGEDVSTVWYIFIASNLQDLVKLIKYRFCFQAFRGKNWLDCGVKSCQKVVSKTHFLMKKVLLWQRKKRRSAIAAAAFALSVLVCSRDQLSQYVSYGGTRSQHAEISLVQPRKLVPQLARGGSTLVPRKSIFKKNSHVETIVEDATRNTGNTMREALSSLGDYMKGTKSDALILLLATALVTPLSLRLGISPILGFLSSGMLLGPNGFGLINGIHSTEVLAELGIVFFLFEMGIELSMERLMQMRKDVFGLGFSQYVLTALAIASVGSLFGLPANALVVLGGGLALSSSAFVLQLLKDKQELATRYGKASFGVLLFQDLAVVPLLVVVPILAGSGTSLAKAMGSAVIKASMALGTIALAGHYLLNPLFKIVAEAKSQEAFLGVILLTVLSMSFMTEGLGLSNTLGAFLAGVLLSETKYRYQIEADIAPFRGILLGFFFVTVGFEIDLRLIASNLPTVSSVVMGIIAIKAIVLTALCLAFGLSLSTAQHTGLILSQGGEFAFLAFGLARSVGILDKPTTKLLLTCVSVTMALTPLLDQLGSKIAKRLEEESDFTHYLGQDRDAAEIKESTGFVVVAGYGAVGKVVCDMLDRKLIRYECLDLDPNKAIQARNKGLPVFFGDIGRPEVAEAFGVEKAKAVILCISDKAQCTRAAITLRRTYPKLKIFARATDADHATRLQKTLDVIAMVPILPEDNLLLTLPFGGAVLRGLGAAPEEVNAILESKRKEVLSGKGLRDNEEETRLFQLGVAVEVDKDAVATKAVEDEKDADDRDGGKESKTTKEKKLTATEAAAAAAVEETKGKSPMVAEFIEANVPGSVKGEDATEAETDISEASFAEK